MTYVISKNSQIVNEIINDPSVRPFVGALGSGQLSVASLFSDGAFAVLSQEKTLSPKGKVNGAKYHGGAVLVPDGDGGLEAHTFALPSGRGGMVAGDMDVASGEILSQGFKRIYGYTPVSNEAACKFNEKIGFKQNGKSERDFGGEMQDCYLYERTQ